MALLGDLMKRWKGEASQSRLKFKTLHCSRSSATRLDGECQSCCGLCIQDIINEEISRYLLPAANLRPCCSQCTGLPCSGLQPRWCMKKRASGHSGLRELHSWLSGGSQGQRGPMGPRGSFKRCELFLKGLLLTDTMTAVIKCFELNLYKINLINHFKSISYC